MLFYHNLPFMKKKTLVICGTILGIATIALISSCRTIPKGAVAVSPFHSDQYLGKWHEIARFDYRFERHLNQVTAEYSLNSNHTIKVKNRGFHSEKKEWKEAIGKAKFVESPEVGKLKVSFFGPFYTGYNVIAIDEGYKYALVAGKNLKYLWILSREKTIPEEVKQKYLTLATSIGYDVSQLIWVDQKI